MLEKKVEASDLIKIAPGPPRQNFLFKIDLIDHEILNQKLETTTVTTIIFLLPHHHRYFPPGPFIPPSPPPPPF